LSALATSGSSRLVAVGLVNRVARPALVLR